VVEVSAPGHGLVRRDTKVVEVHPSGEAPQQAGYDVARRKEHSSTEDNGGTKSRARLMMSRARLMNGRTRQMSGRTRRRSGIQRNPLRKNLFQRNPLRKNPFQGNPCRRKVLRATSVRSFVLLASIPQHFWTRMAGRDLILI